MGDGDCCNNHYSQKRETMITVFLGGTLGDDWRSEFVESLGSNVNPFNPIVEDWNEGAQKIEEQKKATSDYNLYVITPSMKGVFSICEVVDDSNKKPEQTIFVPLFEYNNKKFLKDEWKSLVAVAKVVDKNGAYVFSTLEKASTALNGLGKLAK